MPSKARKERAMKYPYSSSAAKIVERQELRAWKDVPNIVANMMQLVDEIPLPNGDGLRREPPSFSASCTAENTYVEEACSNSQMPHSEIDQDANNSENLANNLEQPLPDKWQMLRDLGAKLPPVPLFNLNIKENNGTEMATSSNSNMDCEMDKNGQNEISSSNDDYDKENSKIYNTENAQPNNNIKEKDLLLLAGNNWLNDEVINCYLELVVKRSEKNSYLPKVYAFSTFLYPKLTQMGFATVKKWTKKVNIFSYQMLLIPIHLGNHWCMAIVDFEHQRIDYYDSLLGNNQQCLQILNDYLNQESQDKRNHPFDTYNWAFTCRNDIPIQNNLSDCGVFACIYAEYRSRGAEINFTQEHIQYFRQKMAYEIKENNIE